MNVLRGLALIALLATPLRAGEAGDLVFAERGRWDLSQGPLVWTLRQTGPEVGGFAPLGEGTVTLAAVAPDAADGPPALELTEQTPRITRRIGPFPASGGDPALTFFLETIARDMAALTGGSPFYIRNRLKDALFRDGAVRREGEATVAVFTPFAQDENRGRMAGFDTLELRFTLDDPKRPIRRMLAETGPLAGGRAAYHSEMVLK